MYGFIYGTGHSPLTIFQIGHIALYDRLDVELLSARPQIDMSIEAGM